MANDVLSLSSFIPASSSSNADVAHRLGSFEMHSTSAATSSQDTSSVRFNLGSHDGSSVTSSVEEKEAHGQLKSVAEETVM